MNSSSNSKGLYRLTIESGPHRGLAFDIVDPETLIGRDSSNALSLCDDVTVSGCHARLSITSESPHIVDLGGKNGITVERKGARQEVDGSWTLAPGDRIHLGSTRMLFERAPAAPKSEDRVAAQQATLGLSVSQDEHSLRYRFVESAPLSNQYTMKIEKGVLDGLNRRLRSLTQVSSVTEGTENRATEALLDATALALAHAVVPPRVLERVSQAGGCPLVVAHDSELVDIPWELIHCGENEHWCTRFDFARQIVIEDFSVEGRSPRPNAGLRVLIVSAPTDDLHGLHGDSEALLRLLRQSGNGIEVEYLAGRRVTPEALLAAMNGVDIVYYIGHGVFDVASPESTGWLLADGCFGIGHFRSLAHPPRFVFSNACDSAREHGHPKTEYGYAENIGMASSFLLAGVEHVLGPAWPVPVEQAAAYGHEVFSSLLQGVSIGAAVRQARLALRESAWPGDSTWAAYILYGEPSASLLG